jgi:hypothetical protein
MLHLGTNESWTLARFYMLKLNDSPELTVEIECHAIF